MGTTPAAKLAKLNESERRLVARMRETMTQLDSIQLDADEDNIDAKASEVVKLQAVLTTVEHSLNNLRANRLAVVRALAEAKADELIRRAETIEREAAAIKQRALAAFRTFVEVEQIDLADPNAYELIFAVRTTRMLMEANVIRQQAQRILNDPCPAVGRVQIDEAADLDALIDAVLASETDRPSIPAVCAWWDRTAAAIAAKGFTFSGTVALAWNAGEIDVQESSMRAMRENNDGRQVAEVHA